MQIPISKNYCSIVGIPCKEHNRKGCKIGLNKCPHRSFISSGIHEASEKKKKKQRNNE